MSKFNLAQRVVIVVALAAALILLGLWVTVIGGHQFGLNHIRSLVWYSAPPGALHPWVRALVWLALIVVWAAVSVWLLGARRMKAE